jgi:hypothetical protein
LAVDKLALGFFIGAGCPCAVSGAESNGSDKEPLIPDIKGLTEKVLADLSRSAEVNESYNLLATKMAKDDYQNPNIEVILGHVRDLSNVVVNGDVSGLTLADLKALEKAVANSISATVDKDLPLESTPYHKFAKFVGANRMLAPELFTTNYDRLMEQALEVSRVPFFDGFVGSSRPFFDQRAIEEDAIPPRWARLWKLHGSHNWRYNRTTKEIFRSTVSTDGDELLIQPSNMKYDESRRMPYFVMIDRLRRFIKQDNRAAALFIVGYSFNDEHLNEAIVESLKSNPSAACFALQYGKITDYPNALKLAKDHTNLTLACSDSAVIRGQEGEWGLPTSASSDLMNLSFQTSGQKNSTSNADSAAGSEGDDVQSCACLLGDFASFGHFVEKICEYHEDDSAGL